MELTEEWIAYYFYIFNREYFGNELPTPRFLIIQSNKVRGQCTAKHWRSGCPDFYIKLNNRFEQTEYQYQCTLLHEMIHLYFQSRGEWNVGHGEKFREVAIRFRNIGWNIMIPRSGK